MDFTGMMKNAASGAVGNIEKAVIEIVDCRKQTQTTEAAVQAKGSTGGVGSSLISSPDFTKGISKLKGKNTVENDIPAGASRKLFYVQFNPSELSFSGYGGGQMAKTDFNAGANGITYESVDVRITMEVKLIFDKVNAKDAFMADKWNMAPTSMATGVAQLGMAAAKKTDYSVQKEVEGFVAALRSMYTREINFYWGNLCYSGILHRIASQYTMFNVQGEPVHGEVQLSITCADKNITETNMGKWEEYYEEAFQSKNQSYVKGTQKLGNMLNVNL